MNIFDLFVGSPLKGKEIYSYLVVAALQEELNEFYKLDAAFSKHKVKQDDAYEVSFQNDKRDIKVLTYSPDKMGMPYNAASLMKIISIHKPVNTLFIGTCACIGKKHDLGTVLIPQRVFSYESGKYENGIFLPDYEAYSTGDVLRKQAALLYSRISKNLQYKVITGEDFCSGGAVINDEKYAEEIQKRCGRKLSGMDMESYAVACVNDILNPKRELIIIKSISDYAQNKSESEVKGNKQLAKENAAKFAFELIKHLDNLYNESSNNVEIDPLPWIP